MLHVRTLAAAALVAAVGLGTVGCVDETAHQRALARNTELERQLAAYKDAHADLQTNYEKLRSERDSAMGRLSGARTDQETAASKVAALETELQNRMDDMKAMAEKASALHEELQKTQVALDEAERARQAMTAVYVANVAAKVPLPDAVAAELGRLVARHPDMVQLVENRSTVRFIGDAAFDSGSVTVKDSVRPVVGSLAKVLTAPSAGDIMVTVVGHTDNQPVGKAATKAMLKGMGRSPDNEGLSRARADAFATLLREAGVPSSRLLTDGRGDADPIADNKTDADRAANRRVDVVLTVVPPLPAGS